jgi:flavin-dependent dehydrogenase
MRELRRSGQESAYRTLLDAAAPGLGDLVAGAVDHSRLRGWRGAVGQVRRAWGPGWALVGDAGYFKDPITAHGITDALRDAELLANAIVATSGRGIAAQHAALAGYQETRDRLSRALWEATEEVACFGWDAARARILLRAVSASMSDEIDHLVGLPGRLLFARLTPDNTDASSVA